MSLWVSEVGSIPGCASRAQSNHYFKVGGHQTNTTDTQGLSVRHWYERGMRALVVQYASATVFQ